MKVASFIYVLKCPTTGEIRYVGKANDVERRFRQHMHEAKHGISYRCCWIRSLVAKGLCPLMEIDTSIGDGQCWKEIERARITHHRDMGCRLTNFTDGGDGGLDMNSEARAALSERQRRIYADPDLRRRTSERMKELWRDPIYAARQSAALKTACNEPRYLAELSARTKVSNASKDARARASESMKAVCSDAEFVRRRTEKGKATRASDEYKAAASARAKLAWQKPGQVERAREIRQELLKDEGFRQRLSDGIKRSMTQERRNQIAAAQRARWADPVARAKRIDAIRAAAMKSKGQPQ